MEAGVLETVVFARPEKCFRGRGDDAVGSPHQAQIPQFELFELKFFELYPLIEI